MSNRYPAYVLVKDLRPGDVFVGSAGIVGTIVDRKGAQIKVDTGAGDSRGTAYPHGEMSIADLTSSGRGEVLVLMRDPLPSTAVKIGDGDYA